MIHSEKAKTQIEPLTGGTAQRRNDWYASKIDKGTNERYKRNKTRVKYISTGTKRA